MGNFRQLCGGAARRLGGAVLSVALWTLWLLLAALLATQVWWLAARELAVPGFVLRAFEDRLAASQLTATFGRTAFDPSGRILVEDVRLSAPSFREPLATVRAAYVRLDPWALLAGRFEPRELQVSGVSLFVPAMLSATGRPQALVEDLDAVLVPGDDDLEVRLLTTRLAGLAITARGAVHTATWRHERGAPLPLADFLSRDFPRLGRALAEYSRRLAALDEPSLSLELSPSASRGAIVNASLFARGFAYDGAEARNVSAATRFPLAGETAVKAQVDLAADAFTLPASLGGIDAQDLRLRLRGTLRPEQLAFDPEEAEVRAGRAAARGFDATPLAASVTRADGVLRGSAIAQLGDAPVGVAGSADLAEKSAVFHVVARPTNRLLASVSPLAGRDLAGLLRLGAPPDVEADVRLAPGWKPGAVTARLAAQRLVVRDVPLDDVSGRISFDGTTVEATDIVLHQGDNVARGRYTMDTATRDYRFLLTGRLRPGGIDGWFHEWWPRFFAHFDFAAAPPEADVDVQGRWGDPALSNVFIGVAARGPVIRTVPFDRVRTRLFIRPEFYDALDLHVTRGAGSAEGTFTRRVDLAANEFRDMDFDVVSTLDVQETARLFGPAGVDLVAPFRFATPPHLRISGRLDGPAAAGGEHQRVHIEAQSAGPFALFDFPLGDLAFSADLHDDDLLLPRVDVRFAGGTGTGRVHLSGREPDRRLEFDYALKGANLAQTITTLENFAARGGKPRPEAGGELLEKAADIRLDVAAAAAGPYHDLRGFQGSGRAELAGPQLGQVRLLGLLSQLLDFTSLRFTRLQTDFELAGPTIVFPSLKVSGANSEIEARGTYSLDRDLLDFNAKVFPLAESKFFLPQVFSAVLKPLSEILEVKLSGTLGRPKWTFVHSPTNLFRDLSPAVPGAPAAPVPAPLAP